MDEMHKVLLDAVNRNLRAIEKQHAHIDKCNKDVLKLRYYIYALAVVVMVMLGKPEWIAVLI